MAVRGPMAVVRCRSLGVWGSKVKHVLALLCAGVAMLVVNEVPARADTPQGAARESLWVSKGYEGGGPIQLTGRLQFIRKSGTASISPGWPATPMAPVMSGPVPSQTLTGTTLNGANVSGSCTGTGTGASSPDGGFSTNGTSIVVKLNCQAGITGGPLSTFVLIVRMHGAANYPPVYLGGSGGGSGEAVGTYVMR